jgi:uncharacterized protein (DUF362 family)
MTVSKVVIVRGDDPAVMVPKGLDKLAIRVRGRKIVIKPNLIANRPYPVTTAPETVEALIKYFGGNEVIIAEGSGFGDTCVIYRDQGYFELAERHGVRLIDLNRDEFEVLERPEATVLKRFEFPLTLEDAYLISAAVLKRHSQARVTLSLKNMLGATVGRDKGRFHRLGLSESIVDINLYKRPDLAVIDGRLGLGSELGGHTQRFGIMIFSTDPVAADAVGAKLLGYDPLGIKHLRLAQEKGLGICDLKGIKIIEFKS